MKYLISILVGIIVMAGSLVFHDYTKQPLSGTFSPTGGSTYRIASSIGTSNTTVKLSSFKEPVSNIPYTMSYLNSSIEYGTIDPQTTRSEFISFTGISQNSDGSATLSGVIRGLTRTPAGDFCTASSSLAQSHPGQSAFILSNSPCFYAEYTPLRNAATSSAILVFGSSTPPRLDNDSIHRTGTYIATTSEFATYSLVAAVANAGTVNSTEAVKGIVELATRLEAASSTSLGSTGASLVLQSKNATDTPQNCSTPATGGCIVLSALTGYIKQAWLDLTALWTFSGGLTSTGTTTISASNVNTNPVIFNSLAYRYPTTRGASSSVMMENGSGGLSWLRPDFGVVASTTLGVAVASTTLSGIPAATDLRIIVDTPSIAGSNVLSLQFNADTNSNYAWTTVDHAGASTNASAVKVIRLNTANSSFAYYSVIDVSDALSSNKHLRVFTTAESGVSSSVGWYTIGALWGNTTAQISSVTIGATTQLPAGTRITVYASTQ